MLAKSWTQHRILELQSHSHCIKRYSFKFENIMDLYGDLPPAQGEHTSKPAERFGPASSAEIEPQQKPKPTLKVPASLAFKPRQATQPAQVRPNLEKMAPGIQKPPVRATAAAVQVTSTSAGNNGNNGTSVAQDDTSSSEHKDEFNTNSSFDVEDAYDPSRPNDYIAYCSERLERRKQARVQEDNIRRMNEADRAREALEKERREAAQRGDYQSLLSSASSMSAVGGMTLGMGAGTSAEAEGAGSSSGAGRGRGRGRGLINLPAWMTQQQFAEPAAAHTSPQPSDLSTPAEQFQDAGIVGIVGIKRKQGVSKPSCVILLKNMVAAAEVDEQLAAETQQECLKYGPVEHCVVHTVPALFEGVLCPEQERVRTFVSFEGQESAVKAFRDLNGRFFAGRQISASFFPEQRFLQGDLAPDSAERAKWGDISNSSS